MPIIVTHHETCYTNTPSAPLPPKCVIRSDDITMGPPFPCGYCLTWWRKCRCSDTRISESSSSGMKRWLWFVVMPPILIPMLAIQPSRHESACETQCVHFRSGPDIIYCTRVMSVMVNTWCAWRLAVAGASWGGEWLPLLLQNNGRRTENVNYSVFTRLSST